METTTNVHQKMRFGDASARSAGLCPALATHSLGSTRQQASRQEWAGTGIGVGGSFWWPEKSKEWGPAAGNRSQLSGAAQGDQCGVCFSELMLLPALPPTLCPFLGELSAHSGSTVSWGPVAHGDRLGLCLGSLSPLSLTTGKHLSLTEDGLNHLFLPLNRDREMLKGSREAGGGTRAPPSGPMGLENRDACHGEGWGAQMFPRCSPNKTEGCCRGAPSPSRLTPLGARCCA